MTQVAQVVVLTGNAVVIGQDGVIRPLKVGDVIEKGETLRTLAAASVELLMQDGQVLGLASGQELRLDDSLAQTELTPTAQESALQIQTPQAVLQALEQGGDLDDELEDPGAGAEAGGGGDGSSFVRLLRIVEGVEPLSYEYGIGGLPQIEEVLLEGAPAIDDHDEPVVSLLGGAAGTEGYAARFTLDFSTDPVSPVDVTLSLGQAGDSATRVGAEADYTGTAVYDGSGNKLADVAIDGSFTLTGLVGDTEFYVQTLDDERDEESEFLTVTITSTGVGATVSATNHGAMATIEDNDTPAVRVGDIRISEGKDAVFTVQLTGAAAGSQLMLALAPSGTNEATKGADYKVTTFQYSLDGGGSWNDGTEGMPFNVNPGDSQVLVRTDTFNDMDDEPDETFTLTAQLSSLGQDYRDSATGTIEDDDVPVASVSVSPASVDEDGLVNLVYTVTLDRAPAVDTVVKLGWSGTATAGSGPESDFSGARPATITVLAGQTTGSTTVTIDPTPDTLDEPDETVIARIEAGSGYAVSATAGSATGTIEDDDVLPRAGDGKSYVSEEGLPGGIKDDSGSQPLPSNDVTDLATYEGSLALIRNGPAPLTVELINPVASRLGETSLSWAYGTSHAVLIGSDTSGAVIRVMLNDGSTNVGASGMTVSYTVELLRPIQHPVAGEGSAGEDTASLSLKVKVSDGVNLPAYESTLTVTVEDDGPQAQTRTPTGNAGDTVSSPLLLDESTEDLDGTVENDGIDDGVRYAVADFSVYFVTDSEDGNSGHNIAYGADGPGGVSYRLDLTWTDPGTGAVVVVSDGVGSGLYALDRLDPSDGDGDRPGQGPQILLFRNAQGEIEGRTSADSADVYLKLAVDAGGLVSFEFPGLASPSGLAIWHPLKGSEVMAHHDDAVYLSPAFGATGGHALTLTQTVQDADGDTGSASISLAGYAAVAGQQMFAIEDDGPQTGEDLAFNWPALLLDESLVDDPLTPASEGDGVVTVALDYSKLFKVDPGTDGLGTVDYRLVLARTDSVTGAVGSVDGVASGLYALDGTDRSDSDGDGVGQGEEILLYGLDGTTIEGRAGGITGELYFTIQLDAEGDLSFTRNPQYNLWHDDPDDPDDAAYLTLDRDKGDALWLTQTVTDADGDTSATSFSLAGDRAIRTQLFGIEDDGPPPATVYPWTSSPAGPGPVPLVLDESLVDDPATIGSEGNGVRTASGNFALYFDPAPLDPAPLSPDVGTDQPGHVAAYALRLTTASGDDIQEDEVVYSGFHALEAGDLDASEGDDIGQGQPILLFRNALGVIEGKTSANSPDPYFTISVDPAEGRLTFTQHSNIWHASTLSSDDTMCLSPTDVTGAAGVYALTLTQTLTDADGDTSQASINLAGQTAAYLNLAPSTPMFVIQDDGPSVSLGVDTNQLAQLNTSVPDGVGAVFTTTMAGGLRSLFTVNGSWGTDGQGPFADELGFAGLDATGRTTNLLTAAGDPVSLHLESPTLIVGQDMAGGKALEIGIVNTAASGQPAVYQLQTIQYQALGAASQTLVAGLETAKLILSSGAVYLQYHVDGSDADRDAVPLTTSAPLINASDSRFTFLDHVRLGGNGSDVLTGTGGPDFLAGGPGHDTLAGGLGADVFKWKLADQGSSVVPAVDRIVDFAPAQGDLLDLRDLLSGEHSLEGGDWNLGQYLGFDTESGRLALRVDADGIGPGGVTQEIVFDNFPDQDALSLSLTGSAGLHDADLIRELLRQDNLRLDP